jgi:hypothetical protein
MNRAPVVQLHFTVALAGAFLGLAGVGWASSTSCSSSSGSSGCSSVDQAFSGTPAITPVNNDFQSADVGSNYLYNPTLTDQGGSGWTFSSIGTAGGGSNDNGALIYGSEWYADTAPGGSQVAGLQQFSGSTSQASISQEISGFTVGADYDVSLYMTERAYLGKNPSAGDTIEVLLGGQVLGTFTPTTMTWTPVTTSVMQATATTMNLEFLSTSTGVLSTSEVDTLFTDVSIFDPGDPTGVPEPASYLLVGGTLLMLAGLRKLRGSSR